MPQLRPSGRLSVLSWDPRTLVGLLLLCGAASVWAAPAPSRAQSPSWPGITRPAQGVVCDRAAMACFDSRGASVDLTRRYLGSSAALRLSASLSGRPPASEFRLSNGAVCSIPASTCWRDSRRLQADPGLTQAIFGSTAVGDKEVIRARGLCSLSQRGRALFDGSCELRIVSRDSGVTRYAVATSDGRRYLFRRRGDRLELEDATGTWPVEFRDHGYTGIFRWAEITLVATREHSQLPASRPRSSGWGAVMDQWFFGGAN